MKTLYDVTANHPVGKRIDEHRLTAQEKNDLVAELEKAGYEFKDIDVKSHNYYEDGDEILITKEQYDSAPDIFKEQVNYMFKKCRTEMLRKKTRASLRFPLKGKISSERNDRFMGQLIITWENIPEENHMKITNVYWLSHKSNGIGFKFIEPEFEKLSIMNCPEKYLHETELVLKTYALQNKLSEKLARTVIARIQSAMGKHGIVFYRP